MNLPMKHYEVIVTTIEERHIYVSATGPAEAMFEAGRRLNEEPGREKDRYLALREIPEAEWES